MKGEGRWLVHGISEAVLGLASRIAEPGRGIGAGRDVQGGPSPTRTAGSGARRIDTRRVKPPASAALLAIALTACSAGAPSPVSPPSSSTPVPSSAATSTDGLPSPSPTVGGSASVRCDIFDTLLQVDRLLAGQTYEAHFLTIGGRISISIWLVDRAIDPATSAAGLGAANREAISTGLSVSYRIVDQIPCARQVFEIVNPMIVDAKYQAWYMEFIPVEAFTDLRDPTTEQLIEAVNRTGAETRGRAVPPVSPRPVSPRPATGAPATCTWTQARAGIAALEGSAPRNVAAYPIVDGGRGTGTGRSGSGDVEVEVQWDLHDRSETADAVTLQRLGWIADALACFSTRVDQLEFFVVDPSGGLVVYARVPGAQIQPGGRPLPLALIYLRHSPSGSLH